jgi:hypothetical protein
MKTRMVLVVSVMVLGGLVLGGSSAWAKEKCRSGSYKGRKTSGTWEQKTERNQGYMKRDTTWHNQKGTGSRTSQGSWDKAGGTGTYVSSTNTAIGKTTSRSGKVAKQGSNSLIVDGNRTTSRGKTIGVDKTFTKTGAGTASVQSTYAGPQGNTLGVQKTVERTDDGRTVSGTYASSTGKSGTFGSYLDRSQATKQKDQHVTNQDGLTGKRAIATTKNGATTTRETTVTDPLGREHKYTETVTVDNDDYDNNEE